MSEIDTITQLNHARGAQNDLATNSDRRPIGHVYRARLLCGVYHTNLTACRLDKRRSARKSYAGDLSVTSDLRKRWKFVRFFTCGCGRDLYHKNSYTTRPKNAPKCQTPLLDSSHRK